MAVMMVTVYDRDRSNVWNLCTCHPAREMDHQPQRAVPDVPRHQRRALHGHNAAAARVDRDVAQRRVKGSRDALVAGVHGCVAPQAVPEAGREVRLYLRGADKIQGWGWGRG